jgi:SAM-dependent methyltransferase
MICPACGHSDGQIVRRHQAAAAAEHFVPKLRDPHRHEELVGHLCSLWGQDHVDVCVCASCGFGYAVPWVGGDARFYALAHAGDPHYPRNRWEFGRTLTVLKRSKFNRRLRVLEIGAGHGAFLDRVRELGQHAITAADYDEGAVRVLRAKGFATIAGSVSEVTNTEYDVVCLFQTLEHMADLDRVFGELRRILSPRGSLFLSVPNGEAIELQERATGYWDMPPNHVGRWNPTAIRRAAERRGFSVVDVAAEPVSAFKIAWQLAVYGVNARSYVHGTIDNRINGINHRATRGLLKRLVASARFPALLSMHNEFQPLTYWAHLQRPAEPFSGGNEESAQMPSHRRPVRG